MNETLAFMVSKVLAEVMAEGVREGEITFRGSKYCDNVTFLQMIYLLRFFILSKNFINLSIMICF